MKPLPIETFFDLEFAPLPEIYEKCSTIWEPLTLISEALQSLTPRINGKIMRGARVSNQVKLGQGTVVEPNAVIKGPALIGENCEIRNGAYIRENVIIGDGVVIGHSTEVKNSMMHDQAELPHFCYVGDSLIGYKGHLGAGVKVSNLKVTRDEVTLQVKDKMIDTGLRKLGCILGDRSEIGCNSVLNPGTLIGKDTLGMANLSLAGYYPPFSFIKLRQQIEVINRTDLTQDNCKNRLPEEDETPT